MSITEARPFVGKRCAITFTDRLGREFKNVGVIQSTKFVPMYGAYVVTDKDEVRMDKITTIEALCEAVEA